MLRFHLPLIKPDVRISRIRLSDKDSCFRPRNVAVAQAELDKSQLSVQVFVGEPCVAPTRAACASAATTDGAVWRACWVPFDTALLTGPWQK